MSLGHDPADVRNDLVVTRRAMEAGVWFHSSPTYNSGFTYMVLRRAFDENRSAVPKLILKVRDANVPLMRFEVEDSCRRLGIDTINVAQLVSMDPNSGNLVDQLRANGGPLVDELALLRERGLIQNAVLFLTPENSDAAVEAVANPLIDGLTLYWNATQRDCSDSAWLAIQKQNIPVLALRTLGGAGKDKNLTQKNELLAALIQESGSEDSTILNLRLAASERVVRTTIGGTSSLNHLEHFFEASHATQPLDQDLLQRLESLQTLRPS